MKTIKGLPLLLTWLMYSLLFISGCDDSFKYESYESYETAMNPGAAIARGWVPAWIPRDSKEIKIAYINESNESWLAFRAKSETLEKMIANCERASDVVQLPRTWPPENWWPSNLAGSTAPNLNGDYVFFQCHDRTVALSNPALATLYMWTLPR